MSKKGWRYPSLVDCHLILFPAIRQILYDEAEDKRPKYELENSGLENLDKTLFFLQNDVYYHGIFDKAAYLFVSITKGHYFSNGNKRLAAAATAFFLITNGQEVKCTQIPVLVAWFKKYFPTYIVDMELLPINDFPFYHLNKVIAADLNTYSFDMNKAIVAEFFEKIVI